MLAVDGFPAQSGVVGAPGKVLFFGSLVLAPEQVGILVRLVVHLVLFGETVLVMPGIGAAT